jgi:hypothetical protein
MKNKKEQLFTNVQKAQFLFMFCFFAYFFTHLLIHLGA